MRVGVLFLFFFLFLFVYFSLASSLFLFHSVNAACNADRPIIIVVVVAAVEKINSSEFFIREKLAVLDSSFVASRSCPSARVFFSPL